jgi:hypothetical protein
MLILNSNRVSWWTIFLGRQPAVSAVCESEKQLERKSRQFHLWEDATSRPILMNLASLVTSLRQSLVQVLAWVSLRGCSSVTGRKWPFPVLDQYWPWVLSVTHCGGLRTWWNRSHAWTRDVVSVIFMLTSFDRLRLVQLNLCGCSAIKLKVLGLFSASHGEPKNIFWDSAIRYPN